MYSFTYIYIHEYMYVRMYIYIHTKLQPHINIYIYAYVRMTLWKLLRVQGELLRMRSQKELMLKRAQKVQNAVQASEGRAWASNSSSSIVPWALKELLD